jgi:ectoine hydroxylase-related dioxygenase (phytanoyl-CoA dioxygenase family)
MHSLEHDGFTFATPRLDATACAGLAAALPPPDARRGGVRNLLAHPAVIALLRSPIVRELALPLLGPAACAVKATLFDKTPNANWKVPWHQDRAIAVASRLDAPGFGPWSRKRGVLHVEAPAAVLATMLALRIHLDDCADDNGPLRVLPGTHRLGVLAADAIASLVAARGSLSLPASRGDLLLMRPLLVHASSLLARPRIAACCTSSSRAKTPRRR